MCAHRRDAETLGEEKVFTEVSDSVFAALASFAALTALAAALAGGAAVALVGCHGRVHGDEEKNVVLAKLRKPTDKTTRTHTHTEVEKGR